MNAALLPPSLTSSLLPCGLHPSSLLFSLITSHFCPSFPSLHPRLFCCSCFHLGFFFHVAFHSQMRSQTSPVSVMLWPWTGSSAHVPRVWRAAFGCFYFRTWAVCTVITCTWQDLGLWRLHSGLGVFLLTHHKKWFQVFSFSDHQSNGCYFVSRRVIKADYRWDLRFCL